MKVVLPSRGYQQSECLHHFLTFIEPFWLFSLKELLIAFLLCAGT
jgi:hypothetical protein